MCRTCTTRDEGKEGGTGFDARMFTYTRKLSTQTKEKKKKTVFAPKDKTFSVLFAFFPSCGAGLGSHLCLALEPPALCTDGDSGCCDADEVGPVGGDNRDAREVGAPEGVEARDKAV